ncbi:MAG: hypothetical protein RLZZ601_99 [Pseudomonadota bacterium]|jgi:hypothetical protein
MQIISSLKSLDGAQESWFIQNVLFQGAPYSTEFDPSKSTSSTVVYLELYEINLDLINSMKAAGKKVVLYHMGDELADKNIAAYTGCDLVIRNYFFPEILNRTDLKNKILWVPNGYKTGVGPRESRTIQAVASRQYLSCFLGWLSNSASFNGERALFSEVVSAWNGSRKRHTKNVMQWLKHYLSLSKEYLAFTEVAPSCKEDLHLLSSSGFSSGYKVGPYSAVMEGSIFAPCPAGNSPETIRLYDALECGCIPISLDHTFLNSPNALAEFGSPPFITLSSWDKLPVFLEQMKQKISTNPDEVQKMQNDCIAWWGNYKNNIAQKIANRIESLN